LFDEIKEKLVSHFFPFSSKQDSRKLAGGQNGVASAASKMYI